MTDNTYPQSAYELGEPLRTYKATGKVTARTDVVGVLASMFALIAVVLAFISFGNRLVFVLCLIVAIVCAGAVIYAIQTHRAAPHPALWITERGIVYIAGAIVKALTWEQVDALYMSSMDSYLMNKYVKTDHQVSLSNHEQKIVIRIGKEFPDILEIKDFLNQKATALLQPKLMDLFEKGEPVAFGKGKESKDFPKLSKAGVILANKTVPWNHVRGLRTAERESSANTSTLKWPVILLERTDGHDQIADQSAIANYPIFQLIVNQNKAAS